MDPQKYRWGADLKRHGAALAALLAPPFLCVAVSVQKLFACMLEHLRTPQLLASPCTLAAGALLPSILNSQCPHTTAACYHYLLA